MENKSNLDSQIQREFIQTLLNLIEDGVVVHDEQRRISVINSAIEKITKRSRDEIVGIDCHKAFPPNGLCGGGCVFRNGSSRKSKTRREFTVPFVRADGEEIHLKVRSEPILIDGEKAGELAVIRDISEISNLYRQLDRKQNFHGMIGSTPKITKIFETILAVATSEYPVLITGESGTGKELVAHAIHIESCRCGGPFVPVNCGALPDSILESELFGHVRGAFTGAIRDKKGRFELADSGTLFLDEIAEIPLQMQVKLLRVLQEKSFERVGGEKSIRTDIRIIAASNRDIRKMVENGTFREDLYYRICVVPIELPTLRERREDIPNLIDHVLKSITKETQKDIHHLDADAMMLMLSHTWPGNIRELINALQYASVHCTGDTIKKNHLPPEIRFGSSSKGINAAKRGSAKLTLDAIDHALSQTGGNKVKAARILGVGRATLYRFLNKNKQ